jgi:hypothetical protein
VPREQVNGARELPDLRGLSAREALRVLTRIGMRRASRRRIVISQRPARVRDRFRRDLRIADSTARRRGGGRAVSLESEHAMKLSRLLEALERR